MPKAPTTVLGIDIGHYSIKAVCLQRKAKRTLVVGHANLRLDGVITSAEEFASYMRQIIKRIPVRPDAYGIAMSVKESVLRIVDQPETPTELLRDALKLNGKSFLNQEVTGLVLDCALVGPKSRPAPGGKEAPASARAKDMRYLIGGLPETTVDIVWNAADKLKWKAIALALPPACIFNAFEFSQAETYQTGVSMLVDIGHLDTNVLVASKGELGLLRTVEFSGSGLLQHLATRGVGDGPTAIALLQQGDPNALQQAESYIAMLAREISNSIGFHEGQRDESIQKVYISGGLASSAPVLQILVGYVDITCELWNPLATCETTIKKGREEFESDFINLAGATGAALQMLDPKP